jgi:hypothetical protein
MRRGMVSRPLAWSGGMHGAPPSPLPLHPPSLPPLTCTSSSCSIFLYCAGVFETSLSLSVASAMIS